MMTITIDSTDAKIGRSTKKWANFMGSSREGERRVLRAGRRQFFRLRRDLRAGPHPLQAGDDDGFVTRQALSDEAVTVDARPRAHDARRHRVVVRDDPDDAPVLVRANRLV